MIRVHFAVPLLAIQLASVEAAAQDTATRRTSVLGYTWSGTGGDFDIPAASDFVTIPHGLSGPGRLRKWGDGELRLNGMNTYTGGTDIAQGTLQVGDGGRSGSIVGDVANDGLLEFDREDEVVFAGRISGRGAVHYLGAGTTTLTGDHSYTGITVLGDGQLRLGDGGTSGSLAGALYNVGAKLVFDRSDTLTMPQGVHGYGTVVQEGTGTIVLNGPNRFRGGTEIRRGTLVLEGDQGQLQGRLTVWSGATLAGKGAAGSSVFIEDGGTLAADSSGGTLAMKALVLAPGATLRVSLDDMATRRPPRFDVKSDLTLDGTVHIAGSADRGLHRLIAYGGTLTDRTLEIGSVPAGTRPEAWHVRTSRAGRVDLLHDGGQPVRFRLEDNATVDGSGGYWRATGGRDWSADGGAAEGPWTDHALGVFGGRPGTVIVDDSAGTVRFSGAQFIVDGYTIAGPGTLTTTTPNTVLRVGDNAIIATVADGDDNDKAKGGGNSNRVGNGAIRAVISASIAGSGGLVKTDHGTLVLDGINRYRGGTTLKGGTVEIRDDANLGASHAPLAFDGGTLRATGNVTASRPVIVRKEGGIVDTGNHVVRWAGPYTGTGTLTKTGPGILELAAGNAAMGAPGPAGGNPATRSLEPAPGNTATGTLAIAAGTLRAGAPGALGVSLRIVVGTGATLDTANLPQTVAGLANAGTITLASPPSAGAPAASPPGNVLTVRGDYIGHGGVLRLRTALGDSDSPTDRLVIDGGRASGRTHVAIVNAGGLGARTLGNGIEVIRAINGATTTAQTTRDAFALQGGHVDAGAYEYRLYPGDANGAGESWYLRSTAPAAPPDGAMRGPRAMAAAPGRPAYRPETALYAALPAMLAQMDLAMLGNLHRREGDGAVSGAIDAGASRRRAWGRVIDQNTRIRQHGTVAPRSDGWTSGVQLGADLYAGTHHRAGLYGGTLGWRHHVHGDAGGIPDRAVGRLQGRSNHLGAYWTYLADAGWYADAVLQHGRQRGKGAAVSGSNADIRARGTLVSLEAGAPWRLGGRWTGEPQAQLIAAHRHIDDVTLPAASVRQHPGNTVIARLGLRLKGDYAGRHGKAQPYARFNLWHGLPGTDTQSIQGPAGAARIDAARGYTSGEIAAGGTWAVNRHVGLYGEIGRLFPLGGQQRVWAGHAISAGMRLAW